MKTLLAALAVALTGLVLAPVASAAATQEKPQVVCPDSDCSKTCCKKNDKNRMICSTGECKPKEEKKDNHDGHKH